jgi:hypothetical protein
MACHYDWHTLALRALKKVEDDNMLCESRVYVSVFDVLLTFLCGVPELEQYENV